jgi:hypothetical protein
MTTTKTVRHGKLIIAFGAVLPLLVLSPSSAQFMAMVQGKKNGCNSADCQPGHKLANKQTKPIRPHITYPTLGLIGSGHDQDAGKKADGVNHFVPTAFHGKLAQYETKQPKNGNQGGTTGGSGEPSGGGRGPAGNGTPGGITPVSNAAGPSPKASCVTPGSDAKAADIAKLRAQGRLCKSTDDTKSKDTPSGNLPPSVQGSSNPGPVATGPSGAEPPPVGDHTAPDHGLSPGNPPGKDPVPGTPPSNDPGPIGHIPDQPFFNPPSGPGVDTPPFVTADNPPNGKPSPDEPPIVTVGNPPGNNPPSLDGPPQVDAPPSGKDEPGINEPITDSPVDNLPKVDAPQIVVLGIAPPNFAASTNSVPEPGTLALVCGALLTLIMMMRRRKPAMRTTTI